MINQREKIEAISAEVSWDNWKDEHTGRFWKLSDVLHCRLRWLEEHFDSIRKLAGAENEEYNDDEQEIYDTIRMAQAYLKAKPTRHYAIDTVTKLQTKMKSIDRQTEYNHSQ